jgi:hypothetical protein
LENKDNELNKCIIKPSFHTSTKPVKTCIGVGKDALYYRDTKMRTI